MISYYVSGSNQTAFRYTQPISSGSLAISLTNMLTYVSTSISLGTSSYSTTPNSQLIQFNFPQISGSKVADEYRMILWDTTGSVSTIQYKGTVQVFAQQTASYFVSASNKVNYTTQNDTSLSYTSSNEYIIL
jgi:hypothetical protein